MERPRKWTTSHRGHTESQSGDGASHERGRFHEASASAQITILNHVVVTVQPASATLAPLAVQGFTATVIGTTDQRVVWQVQGTACAGGAAVCGSIAHNGAYTAPETAPSPNSMQVVAISSDDTSQSGSANVVDFERRQHFVAASGQRVRGRRGRICAARRRQRIRCGNTRSRIGAARRGVARTTTCSSAGECIAPVTARTWQ